MVEQFLIHWLGPHVSLILVVILLAMLLPIIFKHLEWMMEGVVENIPE